MSWNVPKTINYYFIIYTILAIITTFSITPACSSVPALSQNSNLGGSGKPTQRSEDSENNNENFLWKLFSRGKSFLFGTSPKNSSRRTDHYKDSSSYDPPEHRIVNDGLDHGVQIYDQPSRNEGGGGGWGGWGWPAQTAHTHNDYDHMQLYTLLGGLSFASFLATAVILLTRRNATLFRSSSPTKSVANYLLNGNRKVKTNSLLDKQIHESHEMFVKVPKFVHKISKIFSPWWYVFYKEEEQEQKKEYEEEDREASFVPVKVTKVPTNYL